MDVPSNDPPPYRHPLSEAVSIGAQPLAPTMRNGRLALLSARDVNEADRPAAGARVKPPA
jgi:hypothetical protein